jgi:hypothetical protein
VSYFTQELDGTLMAPVSDRAQVLEEMPGVMERLASRIRELQFQVIRSPILSNFFVFECLLGIIQRVFSHR